ncbi:unnamed protein product [Vitrella brassicaformis CCMP3155]|uniref:Kinesin motor domain-containing protein n=2 Tax=Vitrella brassicaformis TaxID=1169539 RepID=A0A0G4EEC0_VITBC|nr:unnamed protein product [Vitrella brassicaformis CCMP3155]|eukprot:CEL93697.1 unnamed protein product [Vitrella brassicaformis CCMP3155]
MDGSASASTVLADASSGKSCNINVAVRFRPLNDKERELEQQPLYAGKGRCWTVNSPDRRTIINLRSNESYAFDHVFEESASNDEVFDELVKDIVHSAVLGFNGTVFAYGQTASGKTHTMMGNGDKCVKGIVQRAVQEIFALIAKADDECRQREYLVSMSYLEVYNEQLFDLIAEAQSPNTPKKTLQIIGQGADVSVQNAEETKITCSDDVFQLLELGDKMKHIAATNLNERSSRAHTILRLRIESRHLQADDEELGACDIDRTVRVGLLNLVDLAGSENVSKAQTADERKREGGNINKSLLALSRVIEQLSTLEQAKNKMEKSTFVNFRDSKITRLLQNSIGGNARTAVICTVSPSSTCYSESKKTLEFALRAKAITNKPKVNIFADDEQSAIKQLKGEIRVLRQQLNDKYGVEKIQNLTDENSKLREERSRLEAHIAQLAAQIHSAATVVCLPKSQGNKMRRKTIHVPTSSELEQNDSEWVAVEDQQEVSHTHPSPLIHSHHPPSAADKVRRSLGVRRDAEGTMQPQPSAPQEGSRLRDLPSSMAASPPRTPSLPPQLRRPTKAKVSELGVQTDSGAEGDSSVPVWASARIAELEGAVAALGADKAEAKRELDDLADHARQVLDEYGNLEESKKAVESEHDEALRRIAELEAQAKDGTTTAPTSTPDTRPPACDSSVQAGQEEEKMDAARQERDSLRASLAAAEQELAAMRGQPVPSQDTSSELSRLRESESALQQQIQALQAEKALIQEQLHSVGSSNAEYSEKVAVAERIAKLEKAEREKKERELQNAVKARDLTLTQMQEKQQLVDRLKEERSTLELERSDLASRVSHLDGELMALRTQQMANEERWTRRADDIASAMQTSSLSQQQLHALQAEVEKATVAAAGLRHEKASLEAALESQQEDRKKIEETVTAMEKELADLRSEVSKSRQSQSTKNGRLESLEGRVKELMDERKAIEKDKLTLQTAMSNMESANEKLRQEVRVARMAEESVRAALEELQAHVPDHEHQLQATSQQLQAKRLRIDDITQQLDVRSKALHEVEASKVSLEARLDQLTAKNHQLECERQAAEKLRGEVQVALDNSKHGINRKEEELKAVRLDLQKKEGDLARKEDDYERVCGELRGLKDDIERKEAEYKAALRSERARLENAEHVSELLQKEKKQREKLQRDVDGLERDNEDLALERNKLADTIKHLESQLRSAASKDSPDDSGRAVIALKDALAQAEVERDDFRSRLHHAERTAKDTKKELEDLHSEKMEMAEQLKSAEDARASLTAEVHRLQEHIRKAATQGTQSSDQLTEMASRLEEATAHEHSVRKELQGAADALASQKQEYDELFERYEAEQTHNFELKQELESRTAEAVECVRVERARVAKLERDIRGMERELVWGREDRERLVRHVSALEEDLISSISEEQDDSQYVAELAESLAGRIGQLDAQLYDLLDQLSALAGPLHQAYIDIISLDADLHSHQVASEQSHHGELIAELTACLHSTSHDLSQAQQDIRELHTDLGTGEEDKTRLQATLTDTQSQLAETRAALRARTDKVLLDTAVATEPTATADVCVGGEEDTSVECGVNTEYDIDSSEDGAEGGEGGEGEGGGVDGDVARQLRWRVRQLEQQCAILAKTEQGQLYKRLKADKEDEMHKVEERHQRERQALRERIDGLANSLKEESRKRDIAESECARLKQTAADLQMEMSHCRAKIEAMEKIKARQETRLQTMEAGTEPLTERIEKVERENRNLRSAFQRVNDENKKLHGRIRAGAGSYSGELQQHLETLRTAKEELTRERDELTEKNTDLARSYETLRAFCAVKKDKRTYLEQQQQQQPDKPTEYMTRFRTKWPLDSSGRDPYYVLTEGDIDRIVRRAEELLEERRRQEAEEAAAKQAAAERQEKEAALDGTGERGGQDPAVAGEGHAAVGEDEGSGASDSSQTGGDSRPADGKHSQDCKVQ